MPTAQRSANLARRHRLCIFGRHSAQKCTLKVPGGPVDAVAARAAATVGTFPGEALSVRGRRPSPRPSGEPSLPEAGAPPREDGLRLVRVRLGRPRLGNGGTLVGPAPRDRAL